MDAAKVLTIKEIHEQFPSEWVLVDEPELTPALEVLGGRVLHHSSKKAEVYQYAMKHHPVFPAFLYTGEIPRDLVIVLCASGSTPVAG